MKLLELSGQVGACLRIQKESKCARVREDRGAGVVQEVALIRRPRCKPPMPLPMRLPRTTGFRVQDFCLRVWGLGLEDLELRVQDFGIRVQDLGFRVSISGVRF